MKTRKKFFDDRVFYCPKNNEIWIGRPDVKYQGKPWQWFLRTDHTIQRPHKLPKGLVEIDRLPEMSIC